MILKEHAQFILHKLITSYEHSVHSNPFSEDKGKAVRYHMSKYPLYNVQDYENRIEVKEQLEELERLGYIYITFDKDHRDVIVYVDLNLERVETIYREIYGKTPKNLLVFQIKDVLENVVQQLHTPWIKKFIQDEIAYLKKNAKVHSYMGKEKQIVENICKVFLYLDEDHHNYIRNMSVQLFMDSKYFENHLKNSFLSIVRKYEPTYLQAKKEDYEMEDSEIFRSLGFLMYPEVFAWKGNVKIYLHNGEVLTTSCYPKGFLLQADMLDSIEKLEVEKGQKILLVENKTTYYQYLHQASEEEVVIYAGGHFSPERKRFYQLFVLHENPIYLWSDIDLGGFLMYYRLKEEIFSNIKPMRMDRMTFETYLYCGREIFDDYLIKIKQHIEKEDMPDFQDVLECILENKRVLEQEAITLQTI